MKKTFSAAIALLVLICCFSIVPLYASAATSTNNFSFQLDTDEETYILTGATKSLSGAVVVPETYNGLPVTTIGSAAFSYCEDMTSVTIPETVTTIEGVAFQKCTALQTINLPKTINSIANDAFDFCYSLQNITINGDVNGHGNKFINAVGSVLGEGYFVVDGVLYSNYKQYIAVNLSTKKIDHNCLEKYPSGRTEKTYVIPTNTMVIKNEAFSSVVNLETIVVPASATNFYARSFRGLGDKHEKPLTIVMQHNTLSVDMSANTFQNLYPGSKVVLKNDALVETFNEKYSTLVYDFIHDEPGVTFVSAPTPTTSLSLDKTSLSLKINTTGVIAPTQSPINTTDSISFESSDSSIASVDEYGCGKITANGVGTAYITVTSGTKTAVCKVTVTCDHESTSIVNASEVKCTVDGYTGDKVCDICNTTLVKGSVIKAPGCKYVTGPSKPATCTENGYTGEVYCSVCGWVETRSKTLYATGHSYGSWIVDKPGSCTEDGAHHKVCSACGDVVSEAIVAKGHVYSTAWTIDKPATCTEEGSKSHHCKNCSAVKDVTVIDATGHINIWTTIKDPTCTEPGLITELCSDCGHKETTELAPTGHSYGDWVVDKAATCTENGKRHKTCSACGDIVAETVNALGHNYSTVWTTDKAATCTEEGSKSHHCSRCSSKTDVTVIEKKAHSYSSWVTDKTATCAEEGKRHKTCSSCGDVISEVLAKKAHRYSPWVTDKEATCTENGYKYQSCTNCGDKISETLNALGHNYSTEWTIDKAANCTEEGSKSHHCTRCSAKKDVTTVDATGHSYGEWVTYKPATCTKDGERTKTCSGCSHEISEVVPATGHNYSILYTVDKKATCGEDGYKSRHCKNCSATKDKTTIPATGNHSKTYPEIVKPATVNAPGVQRYPCKDCDYVFPDEPIPQLAPGRASAPSLKNTTKGIYIKWDNVNGADKYEVYKKSGKEDAEGEWKKIATVKKKSGSYTTYTDTSTKSGNTYTYNIVAVNEVGSESYSDRHLARTDILRLASPKISKIKNTTKGVYLKWGKISGANEYIIYRKTGSSGEWKELVTIKNGSTVSYTDKTAKTGKTYYYRIFAEERYSVRSSYYDEYKIKFLSAPKLESAKSTKSGVKVTWDKVSGASGYYIYRKTSKGDWVKVGTVKSGSTTSFTDKSAKKGVTYYYTVYAYSGSTKSSYNSPGLKVKDKY